MIERLGLPPVTLAGRDVLDLEPSEELQERHRLRIEHNAATAIRRAILEYMDEVYPRS